MKGKEETDAMPSIQGSKIELTVQGYRRLLRAFSRIPVDVPVHIEIHATAGGRFTSGIATLRDISLKGARLGRIDLEGKFLPCAPFRIHLMLPPAVCPGVRAVGRLVRICTGDAFEVAVAFEDFQAQRGT
ncbi:MAG: PilZ domain-containing protein [Planctomycetes bacterium]|nr:PilZ domain-containing protein [Planctomycetota bacterium]